MNKSHLQIIQTSGSNIDYTVGNMYKRINVRHINMVSIERHASSVAVLIGNSVFSSKTFKAQQERFETIEEAQMFVDELLNLAGQTLFGKFITPLGDEKFFRKSEISIINCNVSEINDYYTIFIGICGTVIQCENFESIEDVMEVYKELA